MPERTYRDLEVDLDDLADAVCDWFEHDGFEVQDFQEGPAIFIQARKQNLMSTLSATTQALNVRLQPLPDGFRVQIGAGEWFDKGVGAVATGLALRFLNPLIALGAGAATGYGIYQQLKLPEQLLDFIEMYVARHAAPRDEPARPVRRSARRSVETEVEDELADLRATPPAPAAGYCGQCGAELRGGDRFCHACGARIEPTEPPAADA